MNGTKKKAGKAISKLAAPAPKAKTISSALDLETVRELARIIDEFGLTEVEADPSGRVRVRRELAVQGGVAAGGHAAAVSPPPPIALAPAPTPEVPADAGTFITSPFVGTFYRAPSPDAPPFSEVGQSVKKGQIVCIVEAMKLMNEIEAESDGKVVEFLVQNGEHIEYGQKLIRLSK
ncbi:MAG TPA: acetyl-CoA carboxylase biotin carboxyl carrier protein [Polyangia bacterium]|nr:acetyl-CoA carboxylase biotin carboxyl carrier protein [Polyangia bacterium]